MGGRRDELANILIQACSSLPGCLSYVVALDTTDPDGIWVTEVWETQASHRASLQRASVQAAIAKGRPLISAFSNRVETAPVGGHGVSTQRDA